MIRTSLEPTPRHVEYRGQQTLNRVCRYIKRQFGSLSEVSTEDLAKFYREFFRLPLAIDYVTFKKHCRQMGIRKVQKDDLPRGMSGYNQDFQGNRLIAINSNLWFGVHLMTAFHELYEILDRHYSKLYPEYKALQGSARERRANKFAICILIGDSSDINWAKLFLSMPSLELHLGDQVFYTIMARIRRVVGGKYPFLLVHYVKPKCPERVNDLVARVVWFNRSRQFLPKQPRRVLRALLPKRFESYTMRWLPKCCYEFQGPVVVQRETGLDFFQFHDLTLFCVPVFSEGELSHIFLFGVKAVDLLGLNDIMNNYKPKIIRELFQLV